MMQGMRKMIVVLIVVGIAGIVPELSATNANLLQQVVWAFCACNVAEHAKGPVGDIIKAFRGRSTSRASGVTDDKQEQEWRK